MKKLTLSILLCCITLSVFSQSDSIRIRTHEVSFDLFDFAFLRTADVAYEYVKNPDIGLGIAARYCFDDETSVNDERYSFSPFLRYYFFSKKDYGSKGFYVEGFLKLYGGQTDVYNIVYSYDVYSEMYPVEKSFFDAAFGVGLGYKYVNKSGFTLDLNFGGGRPFGISDYSLDVIHRGGISIGYRF